MSKTKSTSRRSRKRSKGRESGSAEEKPESLPSQSPAEAGGAAAGEVAQPPERKALPKQGMSRGGPIPGVQGSDPKDRDFAPVVLEKTVIAMPLFKKFEEERGRIDRGETEREPLYDIIIDVSTRYYKGRQEAKIEVQELIAGILTDRNFQKKSTAAQGIFLTKCLFSQQYVFARLEEGVIKRLVQLDGASRIQSEGSAKGRAIYHIWPDFEISKLTTVSITTVKADAARNAFAAFGSGVVWAVMDSGIDRNHPHFSEHKNLRLPDPPDPLQHRDFTALSADISGSSAADDTEQFRKSLLTVGQDEEPLRDEFGHGTHVGGIIAGELKKSDNHKIFATTLHRDENKLVRREQSVIDASISGMAPKCKLVSLKVLDSDGRGSASNLIAAIQWIQEINGHGRRVRIHGVNMSVGYEYDPEWFACGQSPLCVEVDRLVRSGVVVVVAAGNTGYGYVQAQGKRTAVTAGLDLTINDPGNAELAITVGATHREKPHVYGVSYFSSKGPTGDGRLKPDLLAPGEKIISCYSTQRRSVDPGPDVMSGSTVEELEDQIASPGDAAPTEQSVTHDTKATAGDAIIGYYKEDSGTSMAAPHVSGVIAAFLSVRREFIGRPEDVKRIFLSTATDLKREPYFQGHGLVDLMRAIQSV
jgi:serine protease AprX